MCWWGTIGTYKERHAAERYLTNQKSEFHQPIILEEFLQLFQSKMENSDPRGIFLGSFSWRHSDVIITTLRHNFNDVMIKHVLKRIWKQNLYLEQW